MGELNVKPLAIGFCVSDLDRSIEFYSKALGFKLAFQRTAAADHSPILGLDDVSFHEAFLVLDQMLIALFAYDSPETLAARSHAANRIGFTHLSFGVPDIAEAAQRIADQGGTVLAHTRTEEAQAILLGITDPDGNRLELVQRTD